ncbi:MAG: dihydrodipicolinate synthase family protein [Bacteroidales bacterium]
MRDNKRFEGMVAATFTPMDEKGNVKYDVIPSYAEWAAKSGFAGVFVCGTTGESQSLTIEERKLILEKWIECASGRFKVIAHVGSNSQKEAMSLAEHAGLKGADAISSIAPSFFKPGSVKDLVDFFAPVAASAPELPFYYYNMPSMSGVCLPVVDFLKEGSKVIPNLVGVKFTHNNLMEMGQCIALEDQKYEILHGYDEILIAGLAFGAKAGVGSTYNYIPNVYRGIFDAMKENNVEKARQLQDISIKVVEIIIKYGGGVRGGKAIMNLIGIECGPCRSPLSQFSDEEYRNLNADLEQIGFYQL